MSGPNSRSTLFDWAAAPRSCSRSKVPTAGISRSMMNLRNAIMSLQCLPARSNGSLHKNKALAIPSQQVCEKCNPQRQQHEVAGGEACQAVHHVVVGEVHD